MKRQIVWRFEVERESAADCLPRYIEPRRAIGWRLRLPREAPIAVDGLP